MSNEQKELLNEVYDKYTTKYIGYDDVPAKELFLFEIKTNPEFSDKWGLKIEERELNHDERINLCLQLRPETKFAAHYETNETLMNDWNIPTRLITVTRELNRDERIELYNKEYGILGNKYEPPFDDFIDAKLTTRNIPTNEKIESYI